jgi:hypothetical protein
MNAAIWRRSVLAAGKRHRLAPLPNVVIAMWVLSVGGWAANAGHTSTVLVRLLPRYSPKKRRVGG